MVAGEGGFFIFFFFQRGMVATGQPTPSPDSPSPPRCLHWYALPPSLFVRVFSKHVLRAFMVGSGAVTVPRLHGAWIGAWHCWQTVAGHGRRLQPPVFSRFGLGATYAMQTAFTRPSRTGSSECYSFYQGETADFSPSITQYKRAPRPDPLHPHPWEQI